MASTITVTPGTVTKQIDDMQTLLLRQTQATERLSDNVASWVSSQPTPGASVLTVPEKYPATFHGILWPDLTFFLTGVILANLFITLLYRYKRKKWAAEVVSMFNITSKKDLYLRYRRWF